MNLLFQFPIFVGPAGLILLAALAALVVWWWDWRPSLLCLLGIQFGVANVMVQSYQVNPAWMWAHQIVLIIGAGMLAASASQVRLHQHLARPGVGSLRLLALILGGILMRVQMLQIPLPIISYQLAQLFTWFALLAFIMFSFSDHPLHVGVGLSLWLIPTYAICAVLLPNPTLLLLVGTVELLLFLTLSYLTLSAGGRSLIYPYVLNNNLPAGTAVVGSKSLPGGAGD